MVPSELAVNTVPLSCVTASAVIGLLWPWEGNNTFKYLHTSNMFTLLSHSVNFSLLSLMTHYKLP